MMAAFDRGDGDVREHELSSVVLGSGLCLLCAIYGLAAFYHQFFPRNSFLAQFKKRMAKARADSPFSHLHKAISP